MAGLKDRLSPHSVYLKGALRCQAWMAGLGRPGKLKKNAQETEAFSYCLACSSDVSENSLALV
jgi:hypothetical protein